MTKFQMNMWESKFLNRSIYTMEFDKKINKNDYPNGLLTIFRNTNSTQTVIVPPEFSYACSNITYKKKVKSIISDTSKISKVKNICLRQLSKNLFIYSRYTEPWFSKSEREKIYEHWLNNAILGVFDDAMYVYEENSVPKGFITIRQREDVESIGLIGVLPGNHGKGIASQLIAYIEAMASAKGMRELQVTTQKHNIAANRLYQKLGFKKEKCLEVYYYDNNSI